MLLARSKYSLNQFSLLLLLSVYLSIHYLSISLSLSLLLIGLEENPGIIVAGLVGVRGRGRDSI